MMKMMKPKIKDDLIVLEACSPHELDKQLLEHSGRKRQYQYVSLILDDTRLLLRPFHFKKISRRNLQEKLTAEVVESLGLPLDDVEIGHQILREDKANISGLLWGVSRKVLNEYMSIIDKYSLVPLEITAYAVSRLNGFLQKTGHGVGRLLFVDLSRSGNAIVAVLDGGHCPLLRILPIRNCHHLEVEVGRSLRSAQAMERERAIERVVIQGDSEHKEKMIGSMREKFSIEPEVFSDTVHYSGEAGQAPHIKCNFAKNYSMSLTTRKHLSLALSLVTLLLLVLCLAEFARIVTRQIEINTMKTELVYAGEGAER